MKHIFLLIQLFFIHTFSQNLDKKYVLEQTQYHIYKNVKTKFFIYKDTSNIEKRLLRIVFKDNKIRENDNIITGIDSNCSYDDTLQDIIFKNEFFTIESIYCSSDYFRNCYITFKYDIKYNNYFLYKYCEVYTFKNNPDHQKSSKVLTKKDFGRIKIEDFNRKILEEILYKTNKNPK
ncbi:hypothetical protein ABEG63_15855 [Chryseobacterium sp. C39-AII1]|uniref:hypothetical protein n=1 Tax=Chryseobacterium sp. C39-AII1 TaxID=3080332 RepID=UPI003209280A